MKRAIVVVTWSGGMEFTTTCLNRLQGTRFPIVVVMNDAQNVDQDWVDDLQGPFHVIPIFENRYEMGAIKAIYEQTDIEEFLLLQNTILVKDLQVFEIAFGAAGQSISYAFNEYENYCGKYVRSHLDRLSAIPEALTKWHALFFESEFHLDYRNVALADDRYIGCIDGSFNTNNPENYIAEKHGEKRFVEVGKFLDKYRSLDPKYYQGMDMASVRTLKGLEDWAPLEMTFVVEGPDK